MNPLYKYNELIKQNKHGIKEKDQQFRVLNAHARELRFCSQYPHCCSQTSMTPFSGAPTQHFQHIDKIFTHINQSVIQNINISSYFLMVLQKLLEEIEFH